MTEPDQSDIAAPQREVQRLLGRCLLRLQQYELLLKAMLAVQEFSGTTETLPHALDAREAEARDKTLGTLIKRLLGSYIVREGRELPDPTLEHATDAIHVGFRMQLNLPNESYQTLKADLLELVTLRNTLAHHFIEQHDVWTVDGCLRAQDALTQSYAEIDRHFEQLATFAGHLDAARKTAAEAIQSPEFFDMVVNGIGPDGKVHWPMAGIVGALREAFRELAVDGWANLDSAARWISVQRPEQTPQKYGCSRWRHVVHESGQFELRRFTHNEQFGAWFRERASMSC